MSTTDSDISLFALWWPYGCIKTPKTFITAAASQSSHKMSMSVSACISWTGIGQSRMKPHFTWPVWPSGNVIETLFLLENVLHVSAKWVMDAKKWKQCEIQPRVSWILSFFPLAPNERNNWLSRLNLSSATFQTPTLLLSPRSLYCS